MKPFFNALSLLCLTPFAASCACLEVEALYLKFYSSHDATIVGAESSSSGALSTSAASLHNQSYEPTWGLEATISQKAHFANLETRLMGFFFKNSYSLRSHSYPGIGFENTYSPTGPFSSEFVNIIPSSALSYPGDVPSSLSTWPQAASGVDLDGTANMAYNSLDLTWAPEFNLKKNLVLRPVFGVGGLISNFHDRYKLFIQQGTNPVDSELDLNVVVPFEKTFKFNALGPEVGFDLDVVFSKYITLMTNSSFRYLIGQKKGSSYKAFNYDADSDFVNNQTTLKKKNSASQADYIFHAKVVVSAAHRESSSFGLTLGYKLEILPRFFNQALNFQNLPSEGVDFMYQALTAGAFYKF